MPKRGKKEIESENSLPFRNSDPFEIRPVDPTAEEAYEKRKTVTCLVTEQCSKLMH